MDFFLRGPKPPMEWRQTEKWAWRKLLPTMQFLMSAAVKNESFCNDNKFRLNLKYEPEHNGFLVWTFSNYAFMKSQMSGSIDASISVSIYLRTVLVIFQYEQLLFLQGRSAYKMENQVAELFYILRSRTLCLCRWPDTARVGSSSLFCYFSPLVSTFV